MIWPFRKRLQYAREDYTEQDVEQIDEKLREVEEKLAETRVKTAPEIARAVAGAKRVYRKVDQFTEEYARAFGRTNHG